ncbi:MAG TPA: helix-turn-helix transcriptional regulator, partial [Pseudomonadales bacterium]
MTGQADNDPLVHAIYQGPLEDTPWQGFLPLLRERMNALAVSLILRPPAENDPGVILNAARDTDSSEPDITLTLADAGDWQPAAYRERFFALDPFINLPRDTAMSLAELMPGASLANSDYYREYLQPAGVFHVLGADTETPEGLLACLRISRGPEEPEFTTADRALCDFVLPHLSRALRIHARLNRMESERAVYAGAVTRLAVGSILLDDHGRVLDTNDVANTLLERRDGLSVNDGRLQLADRSLTRALQGMIDEVLSARRHQEATVVRALRVPRPSGLHDLGLILRPVPASDYVESQTAPAVAIFIRDPEQQLETSAADIEKLFGFSRAESALTLLLSRGLSIAEAATELGISQHTARAQLKSVFAKAGVTRQ